MWARFYNPKTEVYGSFELKNVATDDFDNKQQQLIGLARSCEEIIESEAVNTFLTALKSDPDAPVNFHKMLVKKRNELTREAPYHPALFTAATIALGTLYGAVVVGGALTFGIYLINEWQCAKDGPSCVKDESIMSYAPFVVPISGLMGSLASCSVAFDNGFSSYYAYQENIKTLTKVIDQISDILEEKNQQSAVRRLTL
jgi:hypothetical protein